MRAAATRISSLVRSIVLTCVAAPVVLVAQTPRVTPDLLLAVPWGMAADSVMARAASAGWEFVKIDDDSDYVFRTTIRGQDAVVFATFAPKGLSRLEAAFAPQPTNEFTYRELTDTLVAQYGPAALSTSADSTVRPARGMLAAVAWPGVLMGFRRDGWISLIFTCPESSPKLPAPRGRVAFVRT